MTTSNTHVQDPHPLSNEEFKHTLFVFEDQANANRLTPKSFQFLISAYQSLVSYYDKIGDPSKEYFLHKTQNLIAQATILLQDEPIDSSSPRNHQTLNFDQHQSLKMKRLDFNINLYKHRNWQKKDVVGVLVQQHQSTTDKLQQHMIDQSRKQELLFAQKMDERKVRSVSRSMASWSQMSVAGRRFSRQTEESPNPQLLLQ